jgi:hypothetical protein
VGNNTLWKIANAPVTLWLLSTVAVGALSATITQYQSCTRDLERDPLEFRKLSDEIVGRNQQLYHKLAGTANEDDYNKQIEAFVFGESFLCRTYLKIEDGSRSAIEGG